MFQLKVICLYHVAVFTPLHCKAVFYIIFSNSQIISSHHTSASWIITEVAVALLLSIHKRNAFTQSLSPPTYYIPHNSLGAGGTKVQKRESSMSPCSPH